MGETTTGTPHKARVLLIDDQPLIGEAVRRMVAGAGDIEYHYVREATRALDEADRLGPTVILQDLMMPDIDGLDLVRQFRSRPSTRDIPLIVLSAQEEPKTKAEAFAIGASDYLVKLPDPVELLARIRHHSRGYISRLERDEAYRALEASQKALANEVAKAARYVRSLLPEPLKEGPIRADWRFIPSTTLGGDTFGYHHLDGDHFALFLLDVSGHGVGPALLSVSALNALRSQSLPGTDFRDPSQVLAALNRAFRMDDQDELYFTIWYGVIHRPSGRLDYAGGGHPPALLLAEGSGIRELESTGPAVGTFDDSEFPSSSISIGGPARLLLYSDGVYEVKRLDGSMWPFAEFVEFLSRPTPPGGSSMDRLIGHAREIQGREAFVDDFSIVEFAIAGPAA